MEINSIIVDNITSQQLALSSTVLSFDSVVNVRESFNNRITSHPTENNNTITDHVFQQNPTFNFKAIITNANRIEDNGQTLIASEVASSNAESSREINDWLDFFEREADRSFIERLSNRFTGATYDELLSELETRLANKTRSVDSNGNPIYGSPTVLPTIYSGGQTVTNSPLNKEGTNSRVNQGYKLLKSIYNNKKTIQLLLKNEIYSNCIVKSLNFERTPENSSVLEFNIIFEQVRLAGSPEEVSISAITLDDIARETNTQKVPKTSQIAPRVRNKRYTENFENQGRLNVPRIRL